MISDLHMGHKNILGFSGDLRGGGNIDEHDTWLINQWNSVIKKRDTVFVLGDVAMSKAALCRCKQLNGSKKLLMGNHDDFPISDYIYLGDFEVIGQGLHRYRKTWLSHAPIHPDELRGKINIHGHVHYKSIKLNGRDDPRYKNVCVEMSYGIPQLFSALTGAN